MEIESQKQIGAKRKEVEQELIELLAETKSDFTLDHVKDVIYNKDEQDALTDAVAMFDNGQGGIELQNLLWTYHDYTPNLDGHSSLCGAQGVLA